MTLIEIENAFVLLEKRITALERLVKGAASSVSQNQITLLLESEIKTLSTSVTALKARMTTAEETIATIV